MNKPAPSSAHESWLVIGAGVSGLGAAKLLRARGARVVVSEKAALSPEKAQAFRQLDVDLRDGGHDPSHLAGIDRVVVSPGLPPSHPLLSLARERHLPIVSEIDLALAAYDGKILAVSGTNGKSTTCAMMAHVLQKEGRVALAGGNFGDPPSAMIAEGRAPDYLVLELSSYQLEQSNGIKPVVAALTSFSHDHIARHGSLKAYLAAKWRIFDHLSPRGLALLPTAVWATAQKLGMSLPPNAVIVDKQVISGLALAEVGIEYGHDQLNAALTLLAVGSVVQRSARSLAPHLADFRGLPHRCERVGTWRGKPIINDSKSTNVESTLVALASQREPVILLMGGQGKGEPYAPLKLEGSRIAALVTFGASGGAIARELKDSVKVHEYPTLAAALAQISGILEQYRASVLFSPGCASFDEFTNYEQRGEVFRKAMSPLCDPPPPPARSSS